MPSVPQHPPAPFDECYKLALEMEACLNHPDMRVDFVRMLGLLPRMRAELQRLKIRYNLNPGERNRSALEHLNRAVEILERGAEGRGIKHG